MQHRYAGLDTETYKICRRTDPYPSMVCSQTYMPGDVGGRIWIRRDSEAPLASLFGYCLATRTTLVGHNIVYDLCVIWRAFPSLGDWIWRLLDERLIECTKIREKLCDIAKGFYRNKTHNRFRRGLLDESPRTYQYTLADLVMLHFGQIIEGKADDDEEESPRLKYDRYDGVSVEQWDELSRIYAANDPVWAVRVAEKQDADEESDPARPGMYCYANAADQTYADFGLALEGWTGLRTDGPHIEKLETKLRGRMSIHDVELRSPTCAACGTTHPCPHCGRSVGARTKPATKSRPGGGLWCVACDGAWGDATGIVCRCGSSSVPPLYRFTTPAAIKEGKASKNVELVKEVVQAICTMHGLAPKRVKPKDRDDKRPDHERAISTDEEQIEALAPYEPRLTKLAEYGKAQKLLSYVEDLKAGTDVHPIHPRWNVLVANGRMSCAAPNITNPPREPGVRESYVPPHGYVFGWVDFAQIELCAFAQACLWLFNGRSRMAELINKGVDLHNTVTANFLNMPLEVFESHRKREEEHGLRDGEISYEKMRAGGKIANFGFLGGMGIDKFMSNNRKVVRDAGLTRQDVVRLKKVWLDTFPELRAYFAMCDRVQKGEKQIVQFVSRRIRGGLSYCDLANTIFSGLAADGGKASMVAAQRALWADRSSPVFHRGYGVGFIHDENMFALLAATAGVSLDWLYGLLLHVMQGYLPDVHVKGSRALGLRWRKSSKEYRVDGVLTPYELSPAYAERLAKGKEWDDRDTLAELDHVPEASDDDYDPTEYAGFEQTPDGLLVPRSGEIQLWDGCVSRHAPTQPHYVR